ncbi:uncharacterized protein LOC121860752 [Homarus americanus]|uniref:Replication protein A 14 kDa subunit-like n=1 Tax=Homarus americanus TaxID=6706 RepID=A0A8J5N4M2_HOMAM|nr:uncharacterized protein LOC121860752 [Homarus americanus]KAG7173246.1 Replication protein A 14 kDa subunit-like [Homarus americanus]
MAQDPEELRMRVNGCTLARNNGRPVILLARVETVDSSRLSMNVTASDKVLIQVVLQQPLQENVEGVVEIHGTAKGRQVLANECITFPVEYTENFDMENYNYAINYMNSVVGNSWKYA